MRGRPIIQWLLFLGVWACLALPIVLVTRGKRAATEASSPDGNTVEAWVTLRFSEEPSYFELLQNNNVLWREGSGDGTEFDSSFPVIIDDFGVELVLRSRLPAAGAVEITVQPDEWPERSQTLWVGGAVNEGLSFSWRRDV